MKKFIKKLIESLFDDDIIDYDDDIIKKHFNRRVINWLINNTKIYYKNDIQNTIENYISYDINNNIIISNKNNEINQLFFTLSIPEWVQLSTINNISLVVFDNTDNLCNMPNIFGGHLQIRSYEHEELIFNNKFYIDALNIVSSEIKSFKNLNLYCNTSIINISFCNNFYSTEGIPSINELDIGFCPKFNKFVDIEDSNELKIRINHCTAFNTLQGLPNSLLGLLVSNCTNLKTLKYLPLYLDFVSVVNGFLKKLECNNSSINNVFDVHGNALKTIKDGPKYVGCEYDVSFNLIHNINANNIQIGHKNSKSYLYMNNNGIKNIQKYNLPKGKYTLIYDYKNIEINTLKK